MTIIEFLSDKFLIEKTEVIKFSSTAPYRYKVYEIPKKNSKKKRIIAHPSKELKSFQRAIVSFLSNKLEVHNSVFSYRKGINIKDNAKIHINSKYLLKMDFENFFLSITPDLFFDELDKYKIDFSTEEKNILYGLLFWCSNREQKHIRLSIGAPSSPMISNFIMRDFDEKINIKCKSMKINYTRYADDITFSTSKKNILFEIPNLVESMLNELYGGKIKINRNKTIFSSKAHNRHVTGITLTNDGKLSIGRNKKRILLSQLHHYLLGKLSEKDICSLKGYLAFACQIEPNFKERVISKYGRKVISDLMKQ